MRSTPRPRFRALVLATGVLTLAACPEKDNETDSATGPTGPTTGTPTTDTPTTGAPTTGTPTTDGATDETITGTTTTTSGETTGTTEPPTGTTTASVTESTTTTEGTTTTTTTGTTGEPADLDAACQSACVVFFECVPRPPFPDMEACTADCVGALGQGEGCLEATVAFNSCLGEMNCEQFEDAFVNEEFGPCEDEFAAMLASCQG